MNRTILVGRLTRDPDLRYTQNGHAVTSFTIAVDRRFSKDDETDFINCVAWRKQAENLAQYMKKGSQIGVDGRLQSRTYEDKDGKTVFVTEVVADNVQFLDSRNSSKKPNNSQQSNERQQVDAYNNEVKQHTQQSFDGVQSNLENNWEPMDISSDDLPF